MLGFLPGHLVERYLPVILYYALFLVASIGFRYVISHWPGHYPLRRILGMVHDYTGTAFGLIVGAEAALPLYAVMVWINLGNGMRYGSRYLACRPALARLPRCRAVCSTVSGLTLDNLLCDRPLGLPWKELHDIVLPNTSQGGARLVAEKLRMAVEAMKIPHISPPAGCRD